MRSVGREHLVHFVRVLLLEFAELALELDLDLEVEVARILLVRLHREVA